MSGNKVYSGFTQNYSMDVRDEDPHLQSKKVSGTVNSDLYSEVSRGADCDEEEEDPTLIYQIVNRRKGTKPPTRFD